jgi:hypothetical protein
VADLNGDGHPDLLATTGAGDSVAVLLSNGHGGFELDRRYPLGGASGTILVGDVTGDGAPDVIVGDALLVNDGHGGLLPPRSLPGAGQATVLGDLDRDGSLDVVLQGPDRVGDGGPLSALLNDGHGRFTLVPGPPRPAPTDVPAAAPAEIALADVDGDGIPDVVMALPYVGDSGQVQIRHGDGRGGFGPPVPLATGGLRPTAVAIGDVDGDGLPDLAVLDENPEKLSSADVSVRLAVRRKGSSRPE